MSNYDPNSDDYHYPPRHKPDPGTEIDRLRAELSDWQTSSEAYRHDAERAEARVAELEALCTAQHGAVARAERAEAELKRVPLWIIEHGYATGHGDTVEDILAELVSDVKEREIVTRCHKYQDGG